MKPWLRDTITAIIAVIVFAILLGLVYPLAITGISQVAFPGDANGQQIHLDGKLVGSKIIGQSFAEAVIGKNGKPEEKEGELVTEARPALLPVASLGDRRRRLQRGGEHVLQPRAEQRQDQGSRRRKHQGLPRTEQEPGHQGRIRPRADRRARSRSTRSTARPRGSTPKSPRPTPGSRPTASRPCAISRWRRVDGLIAKYTSGRGLGFSGEEGVNVLELNLALDRLTGGTS